MWNDYSADFWEILPESDMMRLNLIYEMTIELTLANMYHKQIYLLCEVTVNPTFWEVLPESDIFTLWRDCKADFWECVPELDIITMWSDCKDDLWECVPESDIFTMLNDYRADFGEFLSESDMTRPFHHLSMGQQDCARMARQVSLQRTARHCKTLQHTVTHCNTP